jgi:hypothetical protein
MNDRDRMSFWHWFFKGSGAKPGYRRLLDQWFLIHILVGALLAWVVHIDLTAVADTVLLPLAAILVGLCFAWAGNAQALLQTDDLQKMSKFHPGGFSEYVYTYQSAILAILVTLVAWALAGFSVFDKTWPTPASTGSYFVVKTLLFALSSLTLRECWHVVLGAQWMLLTRYQIREASLKANSDMERQNTPPEAGP